VLRSLSLRHRIARPRRRPRHAVEQARGREPEAFWKAVREHCFLRVTRAGRLKSATDETVGQWLQENPIPADHDRFVTRDGNLLPRRPRPIAKRGRGQDCRGDPDPPDPAFAYGWPQCGQTGPNVNLVVCPHCKEKRIEGARVSTKSGYRKPDAGKKKRGKDRGLLLYPVSAIRNPKLPIRLTDWARRGSSWAASPGGRSSQ
jgi:hypothetical protein